MRALSINVQILAKNQWQTYGLLLVFLGLSVFSTSCNKGNDDNSNDPDRSAMLKNYANNLILPAYENFIDKVDSLELVQTAFAQNPDLAKLELLQTTLLSTYKTWQTVEMYEFGPAAQVLLRSSLNTFPSDTDKIINNIQQGNYNFDVASNISAIGLPALDFLLFGIGSDNAAILNQYTSATDASERLQYLEDLISDISSRSNQVLTAWENGYKDEFIAADGTDIGSSTSLLVNQFNYQYELIKNPKIGIPLGLKSLGTPQPGRTEAFYSGISLDLALVNLENIILVFQGTGINNNQSGASLETYLDELGAEYLQGQTLSDAILAQFAIAKNKLELVPSPLSEAVISNESLVQEAYNEIQKAIVLIKTDMTSAMGIQITYQDSDGD